MTGYKISWFYVPIQKNPFPSEKLISFSSIGSGDYFAIFYTFREKLNLQNIFLIPAFQLCSNFTENYTQWHGCTLEVTMYRSSIPRKSLGAFSYFEGKKRKPESLQYSIICPDLSQEGACHDQKIQQSRPAGSLKDKMHTL